MEVVELALFTIWLAAVAVLVNAPLFNGTRISGLVEMATKTG